MITRRKKKRLSSSSTEQHLFKKKIIIISSLLLIQCCFIWTISGDDCYSSFTDSELQHFEKSNFVHKTKLLETIRNSKISRKEKLSSSSSSSPQYKTTTTRILNQHYQQQLDSNAEDFQTNGNHTTIGAQTCISYNSITYDIYVNFDNYTTNPLCGMTTEEACQDMTAAMVSLTMIITNEGKKSICIDLVANVILMTDLIDTEQESSHACLVKVPPVQMSLRQFFKTTLNVKSFNATSPRLLKCYNYSFSFLIDSTEVIGVRRFENIRVENAITPCISATNVDFYLVRITTSYGFRMINSTVIASLIEMTYGPFEMLDCITNSDIVITGADKVLISRSVFSVNLHAAITVGPTIQISHVEGVQITFCTFELKKASQIQFRSVVQVDINHSNFTYIPVPNPRPHFNELMKGKPTDDSNNSDEDEFTTIKANLVFRIFITKCNFSGKTEYGWIDWISVGKINFARSSFTNNYALSAKSVVSLRLCQEVRFVDCFFEKNVAKHSGAVLINSADFVTVKNTRFYNNTSFKSGGAISILSVSASTCISGVRFINNSALNGNGGAALLDENYMIRVENSLIMANNASIAGGGMYIRNTSMASSIIYSNFYYNRIMLSPSDDELFKSGHFIEGSGGGLSSINSHTFITSSQFYNNEGLRGGACFSNFGKVLGLKDSPMENNLAFIGGAFFGEGLQYDDNPQYFKDNTAIQYGSNVASSIMNFKISFDKIVDNRNVEFPSIYIYPGQLIPIIFKDMIDSFSNNVPLLFERAIIEFNNTMDDVKTNFAIHVNQTNFSNRVEFHISLQKESIDLKQDHHFTLHLKLPFSETKYIQVHLVPCKIDYIIKDGNCQLGFPYSQVIPGIVVASILVMIIGIVIGSCMCSFLSFSIWRIYKRIKRVNVREKSEKEIEEKLLNYDVSYSDYGSLHSVELEKNANYVIPANELKFEKKIGEGASGSVYQAKWNHMDVAVKTIIRKEGSNDMFEKEVMVLVQLRHVNIINFYGICISETQSYMVVELAQNGSLERLIKNMKKGTVKKTLKQKLKILIGIGNGMKYLHGLQPNYLIHRDLKPANIILDYNDNPKVCDFGLSRTVSNHTLTTSLTANIGTLLYMCPELILEEDNEQSASLSKENAKKIDVYAFAIIMWELFFEETPYWNDTCEKINYFNHVSQDQKKIKAFNLLFFVANQEKRPVIPFLDWDEMNTWCNVYLHSEVNSQASSHQFLSAVEGYINIMKLCWATDPSNRPSFEIIMNMLNDLYEMDF